MKISKEKDKYLFWYLKLGDKSDKFSDATVLFCLSFVDETENAINFSSKHSQKCIKFECHLQDDQSHRKIPVWCSRQLFTFLLPCITFQFSEVIFRGSWKKNLSIFSELFFSGFQAICQKFFFIRKTRIEISNLSPLYFSFHWKFVKRWQIYEIRY